MDPLEQPNPGEVCLHILPFAECSVLDGAVSQWLSSEELRRMSGLRSQSARRRFGLSHAFTRRLVGDCLGIPPRDVVFGRTATGKPTIARGDQALGFNLAHCDTHAVVALGRDALVGADIEHHRSVIDALSIGQRYFAPEEADMLAKLEREAVDKAFLQLWVCKEAFVKAIGLGLSYPLDRVLVGGLTSANAHYSAVEQTHGPASEWTLTTFEVDRSYVAVAVRSLRRGVHPVVRVVSADRSWAPGLNDRIGDPIHTQ